MTCQELLNLILDYVGGELVVDKHRTVDLHLSECNRCVVLIETYRHVVRFGKALPKCSPLPAAFEARLREALKPHLSSESEEKKAEGVSG